MKKKILFLCILWCFQNIQANPLIPKNAKYLKSAPIQNALVKPIENEKKITNSPNVTTTSPSSVNDTVFLSQLDSQMILTQIEKVNQKLFIKDSIQRTQILELTEKLNQFTQKTNQIDTLKKQIDSLNKINTFLFEEIYTIKKSFAKSQINEKYEDSIKIAQRLLDGTDYLKWSKQREDLGLGYTLFNLSLSPKFHFLWSNNEKFPKLKTDSLNRLDENDMSRWRDWKDRNGDKFYYYGKLTYEQESYLLNENSDFKMMISNGISGYTQDALNGIYIESGFGLGLLQAACELETLGKCSEKVFSNSKKYASIAILSEFKIGYNFIPSRYLSEFGNNRMSVYADMGWRGNWSVANFNDGEFEFGTSFTKAYFGNMSSGILGNEFLLDLGVGYYF